MTDDAIIEAVGPCDSRLVLDAGCGEGYLARRLAARGAKVVGIDASLRLVTAARHATHADEDADADGSPVRYVCGDLDSLPWRAAPFDLVVCNHVFSHLPDPTRPITEFSRVLRPGGRLAVLMLHPCFYAANIERGVAPGIPATEYFARREIRQRFLIDGAESPAMFTSFIRPLEFYFRALTDAGFAITGLSEPHPTAERLQDDSWWGQAFPAPLFLLITATRARDL